MKAEIVENLQSHVFYHGTSFLAVWPIAKRGFQVWHEPGVEEDVIRRFPGGGDLGKGIYITCDWRVAAYFGDAILQVGLRPGTRILDASVPEDSATIDYLRREFSREILEQMPHKVLPRNKHLTQRELIGLVRYHYARGWHDRIFDSRKRWNESEEHRKVYWALLGELAQCGFHGVGNPGSHHGIVMFDGDRVVLKALAFERVHLEGSSDEDTPIEDQFAAVAGHSSHVEGLADFIAANQAP